MKMPAIVSVWGRLGIDSELGLEKITFWYFGLPRPRKNTKITNLFNIYVE